MNTTATHPAPEEIMALFDRELSAQEIESVSAHVAACPQCKTLTSELTSIASRLSAWRVASTSLEGTSVGIGDIGANRSGWFRQRRFVFGGAPLTSPARWGLGIVGLAVAASVLTFFGLITGTRTMRMAKMGKNQLYATRPIPMVPAPPQNTGSSGHWAGGAGDVATPETDGASREALTQLKERAALSEQLEKTDSDMHMSTSPMSAPVALPQAPMIARSASLSLIVKDFPASRIALDDILTRHHAYAADLKASTVENAPRVLVAFLRVPASDLALTLTELKALGRSEEETQNGEEVTQQHADLVARLKNSRETEQRLQAVLAGRTGKMSDVLEVEQEISRVRGEIESMEAELKNLNHRVEFASVNLTLNEEYQASISIPPLSAGTRLRNAIVSGFRNAGETLLGILLFFAEYGLTLAIWLTIFALPVFWLWRRYRRSLASV